MPATEEKWGARAQWLRSLCFGLPHFAQIVPPIAELWRHISKMAATASEICRFPVWWRLTLGRSKTNRIPNFRPYTDVRIADLCWAPCHLLGNVIWYLRMLVLALSILTSSPNTTFLARFVSDNSGILEKLAFGALSSQPPLTKNLCTGSELLSSCSWLPLIVRFDLLIAPLTFPKIGKKAQISSGTLGFYGYDFLLVINCSRGCILHRFRDSLR